MVSIYDTIRLLSRLTSINYRVLRSWRIRRLGMDVGYPISIQERYKDTLVYFDTYTCSFVVWNRLLSGPM